MDGKDTRGDWTISQVAQRFSCAQQTVLNWINAGKIRAYRLGGNGSWRIPASEIERVRAEWVHRPDVRGAI
jgi:excisionase family DNA binding protein